MAVSTLRTATVAEAERNGDAVADLDAFDAFAEFDDPAGGFVVEDLFLRWNVTKSEALVRQPEIEDFW